MDRIFKRINQQERDHNEQFVERLYNQGREFYDRKRAFLRQRFRSSGVSEAERTMIGEALKLMDEKDSKIQENNVYGVSAMQEAPEPLPPRNQKVTIQ